MGGKEIRSNRELYNVFMISGGGIRILGNGKAYSSINRKLIANPPRIPLQLCIRLGWVQAILDFISMRIIRNNQQIVSLTSPTPLTQHIKLSESRSHQNHSKKNPTRSGNAATYVANLKPRL